MMSVCEKRRYQDNFVANSLKRNDSKYKNWTYGTFARVYRNEFPYLGVFLTELGDYSKIRIRSID